jgi:hypothetical protein
MKRVITKIGETDKRGINSIKVHFLKRTEGILLL